jgi:protein-S-isoprenylcysteine O-methyltransferase Ste14
VKLVDFVNSVVTGPRRRREALTIIAFAIFSVAVVALVVGAVRLDDWLELGPLLPTAAGLIAGLPLLGVGTLLTAWCLIIFRSAGGTPVPFSPPGQLVARGPYLRMRNPMLTGLLVSLLGAGLILRSPSLVLVLTPLVAIGAWIELRLVEEPELERRLGAEYSEYRREVPMLLPRLSRRRGASSS